MTSKCDLCDASLSPEVDREFMEQAPRKKVIKLEMSNLDQRIDDGLDKALRDGKVAQHSAFRFCGHVWFDSKAKLFFEEIRIHGTHVATMKAHTLHELMQVVNNRFGWD